MLKKTILLMTACLLSVLPTAADGVDIAYTINMVLGTDNPRTTHSIIDADVVASQKAVGVTASLLGAIVYNSATLELTAPEGCIMQTSGTVNPGYLTISSGSNSASFGNENYSFWSARNMLEMSVGGGTVEMSGTVMVYNSQNITSEELLRVFLEHGESPKRLKLVADITLTQAAIINNGENIEIDLNGHTISRSLTAADIDGHVFWVKEGGTLTITDTTEGGGGTITGGWAYNGGGINVGSGGTLYLKGGVITDCKSRDTGGGVRNNGTMVMTDGLITHCSSQDCGGIYNGAGATLVFGDPGHISETGNTISYCTSNQGGGGLVNYGKCTIYGGTIHQNTAASNGGAIWNGKDSNGDNDGKMEIWGGGINNNTAGTAGGGIYNQAKGTLDIYGVNMAGNTSPDGGGIYNATEGSNKGQLHITEGTIKNNTVTTHGGGGVTNYGDMSMTGGAISGNTCGGNGGGIWVGTNATLQMQGNPVVKGNRSGTTANNVYLSSGRKIKVSNAFSDGAEIHLTSADGDSKKLTENYYEKHTGTTNAEEFFHYDDTAYGLAVFDGELARLPYVASVTYIDKDGDTQTKDKCLDFSKFGTPDTNDAWMGGDGWYVVSSNITFNSSLLKLIGDMHIVLANSKTLTAKAGIYVPLAAELSIYAQTNKDNASVGKLVASSSATAAIGGSVIDGSCGPINIYGGCITATGGGAAAGIGGGIYNTFTSIDIRRAKVSATGGKLGAGIGAGGDTYINERMWEHDVQHPTQRVDVAPIIYNASISILDSDVTATGGDGGAGIGGGAMGYFLGTVNIENSTVAATGTFFADGKGDHGSGAGIGSGCMGSCYLFRFPQATPMERYATINIKSSTVTATGGDYAAGMGGGTQCDNVPEIDPDTYEGTDLPKYQGGGAIVKVESGTVTVRAGTDAEGIGHGGMIGSYTGKPTSGKLEIYDGARVRTGVNVTYPVTADSRIVCLRHSATGIIEPCDHTNNVPGVSAKYIVDGLFHSDCEYCMAESKRTAHSFSNKTGQCADCGLISLPNDADNEARLEYWLEHDTYSHDFVLTGRTLYKDGSWNTLCLPFNTGYEKNPDGPFNEYPLTGATAMVFSSAAFDGQQGQLTLNFEDRGSEQNGYVMQACLPYLVKWDGDNDLVNPVFRSAKLDAYSTPIGYKQPETESNFYVTFKGTFKPCIWEENPYVLYLGAENNLYYPSPRATVNAFRAYFELEGIKAGNPEAPEPDFIRSFRLNFGDGEETGIEEVEMQQQERENRETAKQQSLYTLGGQRLYAKPTKPGIYVTRGRKVLVK